jgi:hypothetical protein
MAVSAISAISNATSFIQPLLPITQQVSARDLAARVLENSISGPPLAPTALTSATRPSEFLSALERALFRDWATRIEGAEAATFNLALNPLFSGDINVGALLQQAELPTALANASQQAQAAFTSGLASLLSTIQLLGDEGDQVPRIGTLLDFFA